MFILPSEHLPHTATWMAFGADPAIWSASLAEKVCRNQAALALAIARFEPINLLVTRKNKKQAQQLMGDTVTYIECPLDARWMTSGCATAGQILCMTPQQNALLPSALILTAGVENSRQNGIHRWLL